MKTFEECKIKINETELRRLLAEAYKSMFEHDFSGWGINTLYNLRDGSISNGDCVSLSTTYAENFLTLAYTEKWGISLDDENCCVNTTCPGYIAQNWNRIEGHEDYENPVSYIQEKGLAFCDECRDAYISDYVDTEIEKLISEGIEKNGTKYIIELED